MDSDYLYMKLCTLLRRQYDCGNDCPNSKESKDFCDVVKQLAKLTVKTLTVTMKGNIDEINNYCEAIGELSNKFDLEVEF